MFIPEPKKKDIVNCVSDPMSLDIVVNEDEDTTLMDLVADVNARPTSEQASFSALRQELAQALQSLPEREAKVLSLHFGLNGEGPFTLEEVGLKLNLTRERIRQIEKVALKQLKTIPALMETASAIQGKTKTPRKAKTA
jgi:RNA polymerase primary sigma factor